MTNPRYEPGSTYHVTGTGSPDGDLLADSQGRLTIGLDLGPSHTVDEVNAGLQYVPAYWTVRTVRIAPTLTPIRNRFSGRGSSAG